jgi:hypothetical protein
MIGRDNIFETSSDMDSDDDMEPPPGVLYNPSCLPESNIHKKRARLSAWAANPNDMNNHLKRARGSVNKLKHDLDTLDQTDEDWIHSVEASRLKLISLTNQVADDLSRHREDAKALYRLFAFDPKNSLENTTSLGTRSSTNSIFNPANDDAISYPLTILQIQEIVKSYRSSQSALETKIDQYEKVIKESSNSNGKSPRNKLSIPIIYTSVEEVDYTYDHQLVHQPQPQQQKQMSIEDMLQEAETGVKCSLELHHELKEFDHGKETMNMVGVDKLGEATCLELLYEHQQAAASLTSSASQPSTAAKSSSQAGADAIPMLAFPQSFTPRDVRLLVSPLSQFEDRYIGTVYGGGENPQSQAALPGSIIVEENAAILRCSMQSDAAAADTMVRRLRLSLTDWRKIASESKTSTSKHTSLYTNMVQEQLSEMMRLRHELEAYGIATSIPVADEKSVSSPANRESYAAYGGKASNGHGKAAKNQSPSNKATSKAKMTKQPKNSRISSPSTAD